MLQPAELELEEMGELADIIPAMDPEVKIRYRPIPEFDSTTRRSIIPVCEPTLGGNELKYVQQAIETNWISSAGKFIRDFEARFADYCGTQYGIACANGTVAMHLAMATLGLEPGDEVIIPTFTMVATINAVSYCGAKPVLVDMEPTYWQMDTEQVASKITPRTRAIVPVHIYGHPTDMDPLREVADRHGIMVIEDAAEAHGAEYKGRRAGGLGDAAGFSFYGNKIITTGEGGMITTDNKEIARLAWNLRDHAFSTERHFWHKFIGFNYRMTDLQAAVGLAQLEQIDRFVECASPTRPGVQSPTPRHPRNPDTQRGALGEKRLLDVRDHGGRSGVRDESGRTAASTGRQWRRDAYVLYSHALPAGLLEAVQRRTVSGGGEISAGAAFICHPLLR